MLTKFESKSNRVKGLAFHPTRPWILSALHNGVIQLWDYRMGSLIDRFDEHEGPVRGVDFHRTQPLFVSGGDDFKIKIWDYKLRRCLFTLLGHLDYIRTVQFHHEYPWIVSGSDDQTIRIWNWQSRACVSVLTGHNHYVMCVQFHPKEDLLVSSSLDQTVRVWDMSGLRKKTVRGAPPTPEESMQARLNNDLFGGSDAVVKYVLEGHDRGVNWACFHPSLPLIVSAADDRQIKLWRMNETKAWEVDTMRGHTHNISCVIFHPRQELIISNSEDRSIRVWDISKRIGVQTFRRENDRFWILTAHPDQNLLAAGHDSGMIVFKLERERPAYDVVENQVFYCKDRYVRILDISSGRDIPVVSLRRGQGSVLGSGPKSLSYNTYNQQEHNVLIMSDADGGSYELLCFAKGGQVDNQDSRKGSGLAAVFIARNRFAVLGKDKQIAIKNFQNEVTKKIVPPNGSVEGMYFGGTAGRLLLRTDDKVMLFENQSRRVLAEIPAHRVKYVVWNQDLSYVALLSKHSIIIADRQLEHQCTINETIRVKSGVWSSKAVFIFATLNHIKYCLPSGDTGIIRSLDVPVYLTAVQGSNLQCLDREGKARTLQIDMTECAFKQALLKRQYGEVTRMIRNSRLCGQAIINYLKEKGYPEVALHFVDDEKTRFRLALACGQLEVALNSAYELEDDECWHRLGVEALRQGNHQVVEMCYQKTKDFDRLSFLYLLTGNMDKLSKMLKIAEMRKDVMSRFHNALFLGDVETRMTILQECGQLPLAYSLASIHGLEEEAAKLLEAIKEKNIPLPAVNGNAKLLFPPTPIVKEENWPLLEVPGGAFGSLQDAPGAEAEEPVTSPAPVSGATGGGWDDDIEMDFADARQHKSPEAHVVGGGEWDLDDDLDLGDEDAGFGAGAGAAASAGIHTDELGFAAPTPGVSRPSQWLNNSSVAADHVAAGSFETAMQLLHRQIGVVNFKPLKPIFLALYTGSSAFLPTLSPLPAYRTYLQRNAETENPGPKTLPTLAITLPLIKEKLRSAYNSFTAGKFSEAKTEFENIIMSIPLLVVESRSDVAEVKDILNNSREYLLAIRIRVATAEHKEDVRSVELGAYFTHCNLQPAHLLLALRVSMTAAFKSKDYILAASLARRLLELPDVASERNAELRMRTRKILQKSEQEARNEHQLAYDPTKPFVLCARSLIPIYAGAQTVRCPYCNSQYSPEHSKSLCDICQLSKVGLETLGLVCSTSQ